MFNSLFNTQKKPEKTIKLNVKPNTTFNKINQNRINFVNKFKYRDLSKTPFFVCFLSIYIFLNIFLYIISFQVQTKIIETEEVLLINQISKWYIFLFGANNQAAVLSGQWWRILIFPFIDNIYGVQLAFFNLFSFWLTFWVIAYYHEIFVGTKRTFFIAIAGWLLIGALQIFLIHDREMIIYGPDTFSLLFLGSLFAHWLLKKETNPQSSNEIKNKIISVGLFISIKFIFNYFENNNLLLAVSSNLLPLSSHFLAYFVIAIIIGFFQNLIFNYEDISSNWVAYVIITSIIIIIVLIAIQLIEKLSATKNDTGGEIWKHLQNNYQNKFKFNEMFKFLKT